MFRSILILILVCSQYQVLAQSDTLNQTDQDGLKQGYWIFCGKDLPEKGYCDSCKIEEGNYLDGRKTGIWTMYHKNDTIPRLKGTFVNGRPEGNYKNFYSNGKIAEEGNYHLGKQIGLFKSYYQSGCLAHQKYFDESGKEYGTVTYYYDDCDQEIVTGTIKLEYDALKGSGLVESSNCVWNTSAVTQINPAKDSLISKDTISETPQVDSLCACGTTCLFKDGKDFQPNGYNRIYKKNGDLWIDGQFKDGRLYKGNVYQYDADGILLKIEMWKDGLYCCQGEL